MLCGRTDLRNVTRSDAPNVIDGGRGPAPTPPYAAGVNLPAVAGLSGRAGRLGGLSP